MRLSYANWNLWFWYSEWFDLKTSDIRNDLIWKQNPKVSHSSNHLLVVQNSYLLFWESKLYRRFLTYKPIKVQLYEVFVWNQISKQSIAWKVSKYGVSSGLYFPLFGLDTWKYGPEKTPYQDTFHVVEVKCLFRATKRKNNY